MIDYSVLWLALEDFVPVVFFALGLLALTQTSRGLDRRAGGLAGVALGLITAGGMTKPIYKLVLALSGGDIDVTWLDEVLFWCLAPGFVLLASGVRRARRVDGGGSPAEARWAAVIAGVVVVAAAIVGAGGSEAWFFILLLVATVGNVWVVAELVTWARAADERVAGRLFVGSVIVVFVLAGAAATLEQTIANQWIEQIVSTAGQAMFMTAAFRLSGAVRDLRGRRWRRLLRAR